MFIVNVQSQGQNYLWIVEEKKKNLSEKICVKKKKKLKFVSFSKNQPPRDKNVQIWQKPNVDLKKLVKKDNCHNFQGCFSRL